MSPRKFRRPKATTPKAVRKAAGSGVKKKYIPHCQITPGLVPLLETVPGGIKITFPFRLPSRNVASGESRNFWTADKRHGEVKAAVLWALATLKPEPITVPVELTYTDYSKAVVRDANNTEDKYATDTLVRYGLLEDDGPRFVRGVHYYSGKGEPRTELLILETEPMEEPPPPERKPRKPRRKPTKEGSEHE